MHNQEEKQQDRDKPNSKHKTKTEGYVVHISEKMADLELGKIN